LKERQGCHVQKLKDIAYGILMVVLLPVVVVAAACIATYVDDIYDSEDEYGGRG